MAYRIFTKGTSKYTGVSWNKRDKKWTARIYYNNKYESLGYYNCETAAMITYNKRFKEIRYE